MVIFFPIYNEKSVQGERSRTMNSIKYIFYKIYISIKYIFDKIYIREQTKKESVGSWEHALCVV
jgi:hypothetical protein